MEKKRIKYAITPSNAQMKTYINLLNLLNLLNINYQDLILQNNNNNNNNQNINKYKFRS